MKNEIDFQEESRSIIFAFHVPNVDFTDKKNQKNEANEHSQNWIYVEFRRRRRDKKIVHIENERKRTIDEMVMYILHIDRLNLFMNKTNAGNNNNNNQQKILQNAKMKKEKRTINKYKLNINERQAKVHAYAFAFSNTYFLSDFFSFIRYCFHRISSLFVFIEYV